MKHRVILKLCEIFQSTHQIEFGKEDKIERKATPKKVKTKA